jgi:Periplasmic lysozyme inhibitor of I-type lysozyme
VTLLLLAAPLAAAAQPAGKVARIGILLLPAATAVASAEAPRIVSNVLPGTSILVVVAHGDSEPMSVGSYSVRTYAGTNPRFPYDGFIAGTIRPRDGAVDHIVFADLDRDGSPEIVVVIRSVGTGGYLSADAFRLHGTTLLLVESVSGLAKGADPVRALEAKSPR